MATKWNLDPTHSEITFKVKHMMISNVKGSFRTFTAEIESEDDSLQMLKQLLPFRQILYSLIIQTEIIT
jgi:polyisoprenoid-binding protein YceI